MSHFSVLVCAKDRAHLDRVLLPYHEYECTNIPEFLEFVIVPRSQWEPEYQQYIAQEGHEQASEEEFFHEYYGKRMTQNSDGIWGFFTNPNAKWDWWTVGGRWFRWLVTKQGDSVDAAYCAEIDWDALQQRQLNQCLHRYDTWQTKIKHLANKERFHAFLDYGFGLLSLEDAAELDTFSREAYAEKYGNKPLTFAWIGPDGAWGANKDMGWFGMTSDREDLDPAAITTNQGWWAMVRTWPAGWMAFVVDCHI